MALGFTYNVLHNGQRELVFNAAGIDTATTVAFTAESAITGVIAAAMTATSNTYTPTVHNKIRRVLFSTQNCFLRIQWHQSSNVDTLVLGGSSAWGDYNLAAPFAGAGFGSQGLFGPNGAGATGDLDITVVPIAAVSSGSSIVTAGANLTFWISKGIQSPLQ